MLRNQLGVMGKKRRKRRKKNKLLRFSSTWQEDDNKKVQERKYNKEKVLQGFNGKEKQDVVRKEVEENVEFQSIDSKQKSFISAKLQFNNFIISLV